MIFRGVAQLVARAVRDGEVVCSSHITPTRKFKKICENPENFAKTHRNVPVAQLDRALACGAKGRTFESYRAYQNKNLALAGFLFFVMKIRKKLMVKWGNDKLFH